MASLPAFRKPPEQPDTGDALKKLERLKLLKSGRKGKEKTVTYYAGCGVAKMQQLARANPDIRFVMKGGQVYLRK